MKKEVIKSLTEDEYVLVRETRRKQIADLDEENLIKLHNRVRQARNKHVKNYRQAGAAKVGEKGSRGAARPANKNKVAKVEAFEIALSRVSKQLGVAAKRSAAELKDERLAAASGKSPKVSGPPKGQDKVVSAGKARVDATRKSPARKKSAASSKAAGVRRQAKKDSR